MSRDVKPAVRQQVRQRAQQCCEYCLLHEDDTYLGCHIDHIVSRKHGGSNALSNLAYACVYCNLYKGSDVGSFHQTTGMLTRFFHPRKDIWLEHFALVGMRIVPKTDVVSVTAVILKLNHAERLLEREALADKGRYLQNG